MIRILLAASAMLACSACNTVAGFGKDLQAIGGAVAGAATGVKAGTASPASQPPPACPAGAANCPKPK